jgi:hypothetical protein
MTMQATLLHQNDDYIPDGDIDLDLYGEWVNSQDPLTGEIVRVWKPYDDPQTEQNEDLLRIGTIDCIARGIVDGGIRVAGSTERFGETYEDIDFVKLWVPPNTKISKRDRVTNIKDASGHIQWTDEEYSDPALDDTPRATVFNVNGVIPLFNAFNDVTEKFILLEKVEVNAQDQGA